MLSVCHGIENAHASRNEMRLLIICFVDNTPSLCCGVAAEYLNA